MSRFACVVVMTCAALLCEAQTTRISFAEPVTLSGYAGGVAMEWEVYDDSEVEYYAVLRRSGGLDRVVASVQPERRTHAPTTSYRYIDAVITEPGDLYRLRAVFMDESFAESDWLSASRAAATRMRILGALDDESLANLHIDLTSDGEQDVVVRIKSLAGIELDSYPRTLRDGDNRLEIDYRTWDSGYYTVEVGTDFEVAEWLVQVDADEGRAKTRRLPRAY